MCIFWQHHGCVVDLKSLGSPLTNRRLSSIENLMRSIRAPRRIAHVCKVACDISLPGDMLRAVTPSPAELNRVCVYICVPSHWVKELMLIPQPALSISVSFCACLCLRRTFNFCSTLHYFTNSHIVDSFSLRAHAKHFV